MRLVIGFITYGESTAKYLPYFLASLKSQAYKDYMIIAEDNSDEEENGNKKYIRENCPEIEFNYSGGNIGFARANNRIIARAIELGAEYVLFLNPDMVLEPEMAGKLLKKMDEDGILGSAGPKLRRWDYGNNAKTNIIDTCGIVEPKALRFIDLGQGEEDKGQYDGAEILGPSGAAAVYRLSALKKAKDKYGYFDERMFMYKEDCDLAYRLKLAGYRSKLVPDALAYHDRTASSIGAGDIKTALNRKNKSRQVKEWSFLNQQIIFKKHWPSLGLGGKISVLWYAFKMFLFAALFERYLLKQYKKL